MSRLKGSPDFIMSEQTAALVKVLRGVNKDISYATLSRAVGFNITGGTPWLTSARRNLENTEGIVFAVIRGEGLRRLDDSGKVASTTKHARTIGRTARRGKKRLGTVENFTALPMKDQLAATLRATQFEFAAQAVSTRKLPAPAQNATLDIKALTKDILK